MRWARVGIRGGGGGGVEDRVRSRDFGRGTRPRRGSEDGVDGRSFVCGTLNSSTDKTTKVLGCETPI